MTIENGMKFRNVKSNELGTVIETNDKFKTAVIEMENGKTVSYAFTTLKDKRRWVAEGQVMIEDEYDEYDVEQGYPETALDIPVEVTKPKKVKVEEGVGFDIKDFILSVANEHEIEVCISSGRFTSFKVGGKMCAGLFSYSKKSATLGVRSLAIKDYEDLVPTSTLNHSMDARFKFTTLTEDDKSKIVDLLVSSANYQISKNNK